MPMQASMQASPSTQIATIPIENDINFVILYLQARNSEKWGWCGYKVWSKTIRYATGKCDSDDVRKLWQQCFATGHFNKRKVKTRTEYSFTYSLHKNQ